MFRRDGWVYFQSCPTFLLFVCELLGVQTVFFHLGTPRACTGIQTGLSACTKHLIDASEIISSKASFTKNRKMSNFSSVYACPCVWSFMVMCAHVSGVRGQPWVLSCTPPLAFVLRWGSFVGMEHMEQARLSDQQTPGICLSLLSQHWDYKSIPHCPAFMKSGVWGSNLGSCKASTLLTELFGQPQDTEM